MWKIKKILDNKRVVLQLIGRLEGEHLTELQEALEAEGGGGHFALDMKEVKLVDHEAVVFLACCEAGGTELRNCPTYIREWIAREKEETAVTPRN